MTQFVGRVDELTKELVGVHNRCLRVVDLPGALSSAPLDHGTAGDVQINEQACMTISFHPARQREHQVAGIVAGNPPEDQCRSKACDVTKLSAKPLENGL